MTAGALQVPQITQEELFAFHESHFSSRSVRDFHDQFLTVGKARGDGAVASEPLDDVGDAAAYAEGAYDLALGPIDLSTADFGDDTVAVVANPDDEFAGEDGEVSPPKVAEDASAKSSSRKKRRRKKNNGARWAEEKPDLRKRTWDVVDTGLGSLDYDDQQKETQDSSSARPQRRRVQYGDD